MQEMLARLHEATDALLADIEGLQDTDLRTPSLLPNWSRGHVLTHIARNADGGTRLLNWALTGVPSYEYTSVEDRAADIQSGSGRPAGVILDDVRTTAQEFSRTAAMLPAEAWQNIVQWTTGQRTTADRIVVARWHEVLIHHVDAKVDYPVEAWPPSFVQSMLPSVIEPLNDGGLAPIDAFVSDSSTGQQFRLGSPSAGSMEITSTGNQLLGWLLGRCSGVDFNNGEPLPKAPNLWRV